MVQKRLGAGSVYATSQGGVVIVQSTLGASEIRIDAYQLDPQMAMTFAQELIHEAGTALRRVGARYEQDTVGRAERGAGSAGPGPGGADTRALLQDLVDRAGPAPGEPDEALPDPGRAGVEG